MCRGQPQEAVVGGWVGGWVGGGWVAGWLGNMYAPPPLASATPKLGQGWPVCAVAKHLGYQWPRGGGGTRHCGFGDC